MHFGGRARLTFRGQGTLGPGEPRLSAADAAAVSALPAGSAPLLELPGLSVPWSH
jgi:hypothetical protein